jgi:hypothetical protein
MLLSNIGKANVIHIYSNRRVSYLYVLLIKTAAGQTVMFNNSTNTIIAGGTN